MSWAPRLSRADAAGEWDTLSEALATSRAGLSATVAPRMRAHQCAACAQTSKRSVDRSPRGAIGTFRLDS